MTRILKITIVSAVHGLMYLILRANGHEFMVWIVLLVWVLVHLAEIEEKLDSLIREIRVISGKKS